MPLEMMPTSELRTEDAARWADLHLVMQDLQFVIDACRRFVAECQKAPRDDLVLEALWTSAVVKYGRCFATGKRFRLDSDVFVNAPDGAPKAHKFFRDMRDKHVAHSVNPFEEACVGLVFSGRDAQPQNAVAVSFVSRKLVHQDAAGIKPLLSLASFVHKVVEAQARDLGHSICTWAQTQPAGTFQADRIRLVTPGPEDASKPR